MPDVPEVQIVHVTPCRLRVRIPSNRHDKLFFSNLQDELSREPMVERVEVNPVTASILIHSSDSEAVLETLARDGRLALLERLSGAGAAEVDALAEVRRQLTEWNKQLQRWTGSPHDARVYIFTALVLSAAYQIARGEIFAPAATLLWYASEALRLWIPADRAKADSPPRYTEIKDAG